VVSATDVLVANLDWIVSDHIGEVLSGDGHQLASNLGSSLGVKVRDLKDDFKEYVALNVALSVGHNHIVGSRIGTSILDGDGLVDRALVHHSERPLIGDHIDGVHISQLSLDQLHREGITVNGVCWVGVTQLEDQGLDEDWRC
jgi:hypothetical protein